MSHAIIADAIAIGSNGQRVGFAGRIRVPLIGFYYSQCVRLTKADALADAELEAREAAAVGATSFGLKAPRL